MECDPAGVLPAWPDLAPLPVRPLPGGNINESWVVGEPPLAVLQRQHPMFPAAVGEDVDAVTRHAAARGMPTPRLLRTVAGPACALDAEGRAWRALTWVPGRTFDAVAGPTLAAEAGALVARWHLATDDLDHVFAFSRPGAHDTAAHLARLAEAVDEGRGHRLHAEVAALADELIAAWDRWGGSADGTPRIAHGDLKISNLRFDEEDRGICLLDFDTLGHLPLAVELGDAARSWCNPLGEDVAEAAFDVGLFGAAFGAYLATRPLPPEDRAALVPGVERIAIELAARFAADVLREGYFGWNPRAAPTRADHHLLRARGQASLARSIRARRGALEATLR